MLAQIKKQPAHTCGDKMTFMTTARATAAALSLILGLTALPCFAQDYSLLNYTGPDRTEKLIAAAKKEGGLTLYTSIADNDWPPLKADFEKKYGVKLTVCGQTLHSRRGAHRRAGNGSAASRTTIAARHFAGFQKPDTGRGSQTP
jgi:hypothetical protein